MSLKLYSWEKEKKNSLPTHVSFIPLNLYFLPLNKNFGTCFSKKNLLWKKTSECVFNFFFKFELEKFRETHSEVFIQGQNRKAGSRKETQGWEEKN
jgi:hypothetical protein